MHTLLSNLTDLGQVTLAAVIFGAGLPAVFAFGIRFQARVDDGADGGSRAVSQAVASLCFAIVLIAVVVGVLFIAKGFLASRLGIHLFGA
ncbi:hypothetical protein FOH10_00170 [Nocardia otitidiscaviarum]|uniref:Uncharacterized protein n=1 Tax=Nocardia otitidiscaviarum TaxID=1823 RepID=A0A516NEQ7_9NOCA|nr:hypothetical protein [Nocardia otitidiscaviarum]MCP9622638.1 hypothetical protein [Nocardia otitidiscaviarum]QDP77386.1 hypothetical protein FOH10_00170 [Nocardia otitidiscaviarum]